MVMVIGSGYKFSDDVFPPELLQALYWGNELTIPQIANIFNCNCSTIFKKMEKYLIPRRKQGRPVIIFNFDKYQQQVFEGVMLGDGDLQLSQSDIGCRLRNSDINNEYLVWLQKQLGIQHISRIYSSPNRRQLYTQTIPSLRREYDRWYPDGPGTINNIHHKVIPKNINLSITSTLFWYLGDGTYNKRENCIYFTNHLRLNDANHLITQLKSVLNVTEGITVNNDKGRDFYFIRLNKTITNIFLNTISDLNISIPKCYQYKFGMKK